MRRPKAGQPTAYREEYNQQAYRLCLLGLTDAELAHYFNVTETTVNNWKNSYPKFFESILEGRELADAKVAEKLYHRALGYSQKSVKIFNDQGTPLIVPYIENFPPDTNAASLWLRNRQSKKWRDSKALELGGEGGGPIRIVGMTIEELESETTKMLEELKDI